eukprot:TRINITY_DN27746_c0_g1_i1.p1 TRINITY_DN27746_c0_g1~~TRINITY_DN27746_c0_g1_i1.p1  ORF type:complete len:728 (+),score=45.13 TRINITY_DN27746_c0_g1_i1:54-2237(+)
MSILLQTAATVVQENWRRKKRRTTAEISGIARLYTGSSVKHPKRKLVASRWASVRRSIEEGPPSQLISTAKGILLTANSQNLEKDRCKECLLEGVGYCVSQKSLKWVTEHQISVMLAAAWTGMGFEGDFSAFLTNLLAKEFNGTLYNSGDSIILKPEVAAALREALGPLTCLKPALKPPSLKPPPVFIGTPPSCGDLLRGVSNTTSPDTSTGLLGPVLRAPSVELKLELPTIDIDDQNGDQILEITDDDDGQKGVDEDLLAYIREVFDSIDTKCAGILGYTQTQKLWRAVFPNLSHVETDRLTERIFDDIDVNGDGELQWEELSEYLRGEWISSRKKLAVQPDSWRQWVWAVFEQPASEKYKLKPLRSVSFAMLVAIQLCIVASTVNLLVESLPEYQSFDGKTSGTATTFIVELFCIVLFSIEFVARTAACPLQNDQNGMLTLQREYWSSPWTWIDLIAIAPFYLRVSGVTTRVKSLVLLRVLKIARIGRALRIMRLGRNSTGLMLMQRALTRAKFALGFMGLLFVMTVVLTASMVFYVEIADAEYDGNEKKWYDEHTDGSKSLVSFQSIPDAMWWAVVTLTTVGYGDVVPKKPLGKAVASVSMIGGIFLMAYPVTILSNTFTQVYDEWKSDLEKQQRRGQLQNRIEHNIVDRDGVRRSRVSSRKDAALRRVSSRRLLEDNPLLYLNSQARASSRNTSPSLHPMDALDSAASDSSVSLNFKRINSFK